jgi:hypothetical protein
MYRCHPAVEEVDSVGAVESVVAVVAFEVVVTPEAEQDVVG